MTKRLIFAMLLSAGEAHSGWTMKRRIMQGVACSASAFDAASTLRPGLIETNAILGRGKPNAAAIIGIKAGMCALSIGLAEYKHHKYPHDQSFERTLTFTGMGASALYTSFGLHNLAIERNK